MSSTSTTVLITGGNSGIGKGLVAAYLALPSHTVIAAVRNPARADAQALASLPKAEDSNLVVLQISDGASASAIASGISTLKSDHGINKLDIVIANAGHGDLSPKLIDTPVFEIQKVIEINAYGPFELFKATLPLLRHSECAKFCYISSLGGSLTSMNNVANLAPYGASKALANFLFKWLSLDIKDVVIWAQHPGSVRTTMGQMGFEALKDLGIDMSPYIISLEESVGGIQKVIKEADGGNAHGKFLGPDGAEIPW
ncbi:NAD(P)-binding protein [Ophiobolus disseminans]|uniref:NAD(P)-binding protein n=1 Tax=Ophiobolus disseminans TaxID=1469910 RepID=A0A6A7AGR3_9PLEO|nr:NAD(P)-binding protein [Ophiobolus disseminans]